MPNGPARTGIMSHNPVRGMTRPRGAGAHSEREAWEMVRFIAIRLLESYGREPRRVMEAAEALREEADMMLAQLARGVHENPSLVVFGNPPGFTRFQCEVGPKLGEVERLQYRRTARPRGYYFHAFGLGDALHIARTRQGSRIVLIASETLDPLWGNEEEA
jgi:hypothetical protein